MVTLLIKRCINDLELHEIKKIIYSEIWEGKRLGSSKLK